MKNEIYKREYQRIHGLDSSLEVLHNIPGAIVEESKIQVSGRLDIEKTYTLIFLRKVCSRFCS